jgi:hypothetical protein
MLPRTTKLYDRMGNALGETGGSAEIAPSGLQSSGKRSEKVRAIPTLPSECICVENENAFTERCRNPG